MQTGSIRTRDRRYRMSGIIRGHWRSIEHDAGDPRRCRNLRERGIGQRERLLAIALEQMDHRHRRARVGELGISVIGFAKKRDCSGLVTKRVMGIPRKRNPTKKPIQQIIGGRIRLSRTVTSCEAQPRWAFSSNLFHPTAAVCVARHRPIRANIKSRLRPCAGYLEATP